MKDQVNEVLKLAERCAESAIDQAGDYASLQDAILAYEFNISDTIAEMVSHEEFMPLYELALAHYRKLVAA